MFARQTAFHDASVITSVDADVGAVFFFLCVPWLRSCQLKVKIAQPNCQWHCAFYEPLLLCISEGGGESCCLGSQQLVSMTTVVRRELYCSHSEN